jgi:hypothetical protein
MLAFFATTAPIVGPANAYTFTEVIDPKDAVLNDETKGSDDVKAGIASLKEFQSTIKGLKSDLVSSADYIYHASNTLFMYTTRYAVRRSPSHGMPLTSQAKDSQAELRERIKKSLPIASVRNSLNKYNSAFSEDTQRGTDRLIRAVVQVRHVTKRRVEDPTLRCGGLNSELSYNLCCTG